jgi:hypothetical protein
MTAPMLTVRLEAPREDPYSAKQSVVVRTDNKYWDYDPN